MCFLRSYLFSQTKIKGKLARGSLVPRDLAGREALRGLAERGAARSRSRMSIIKIIGIKQYTLAVYYTSADCYKYSIIDDYGAAYEPDDIFYTSEAAEREGRKAINGT